jgi:hypothetical protein
MLLDAQETSTQPESENSIKSEILGLFSGNVRASAFILSPEYDYSMVFSEFNLITSLTEDKFILKSDLRLRTGIKFDDYFNDFELKELYVAYDNRKIGLYLGNQIVNHGRADGFNPTNNLNHINYFFLSSEPDDQIMSNFMLRFKYRLNRNIDLELTGMPFYKPSQYKYELFDLGENVVFKETVLPKKTFLNSSFNARLNFEYSAIGFSLSWYNGYNTFHGFALEEIRFYDQYFIITNAGSPYYKQSIGADFELPASFAIIRGEAACNITTDYEKEMYIPNPDISMVGGIEKEVAGTTLILQYIGKYIIDFKEITPPDITQYNISDPMEMVRYISDNTHYEMTLFNRKSFMQQSGWNHAASLFVMRSLAYDAIKIEVAGMYNFTSEEYLIRPGVRWNLNDHLGFAIGGMYMYGPEASIFNHSKALLNGMFLEMKISF